MAECGRNCKDKYTRVYGAFVTKFLPILSFVYNYVQYVLKVVLIDYYDVRYRTSVYYNNTYNNIKLRWIKISNESP